MIQQVHATELRNGKNDLKAKTHALMLVAALAVCSFPVTAADCEHLAKMAFPTKAMRSAK